MPLPDSRKRRSDSLSNRARILEAAARHLEDAPELNIREVAREAGVSRSTLYRHFATREALEEALRQDALAAARQAVAGAAAEPRPPMALLSRLVGVLVELGADRRLGTLRALPPDPAHEELVSALQPAFERLRAAVEIAPEPPERFRRALARSFVHACLGAGAAEPADPASAARALFGSLTEPLDRGLVALDADGTLLCLNSRAEEMIPVGPGAEPGTDLLYEDGSPSPAAAYPLSVAVRTHEPQTAVRGHRGPDGRLSWVEVAAHPLRDPAGDSVYGFLGVLADVTAERDWEHRQLRPPGDLGPRRPVPLDIARILDEIPPHLFPEQFASEARRLSGGPVALYVLDIDGTHLLRLAGPDDFPERLEAPLALGPELAEDGIPELAAHVASELPGVSMAPMWLRGRAIGLLLALATPAGALVELARHGAAAMELAGGYTDVFDAARRRKETEPAAELQQSLLPPRIARIGGGEIAGSVLPAYEVGGDWFDYVENRDGAWIAVADAVGKGSTAGALGGIALAALRAARRGDATLEEAAKTMHEAIFDVSRPEFFVTAIIARWNAVYSSFSWISCGHPPPLVVRADDTIEQLVTEADLPLGLWDRERRFVRHQRRLQPGERLILHSDGITARRTPDGLFGLDGIERAVRDAGSRSAPATAKAIQEAVMHAAEDRLQDDAVAVVLAPAR
jgi:AcrR family transcriptional regulator